MYRAVSVWEDFWFDTYGSMHAEGRMKVKERLWADFGRSGFGIDVDEETWNEAYPNGAPERATRQKAGRQGVRDRIDSDLGVEVAAGAFLEPPVG